MDLLREVQQFLADEADAQRFAWEGNTYLDPNDIKLREVWRGFGPLPPEEEGRVEGVKMGGFHDSIPLEHQAEWDAYLKRNPEAFSGKAAAGTYTLDHSSCEVTIDNASHTLTLQSGWGQATIRREDYAQLISILQAALALALLNEDHTQILRNGHAQLVGLPSQL